MEKNADRVWEELNITLINLKVRELLTDEQYNLLSDDIESIVDSIREA